MTELQLLKQAELWQIYKLMQKSLLTEEWQEKTKKILFIKQREKFNAVIEDVTELSKAGRPVLIGTTSVKFQNYCRMLKMRGVAQQMQNAQTRSTNCGRSWKTRRSNHCNKHGWSWYRYQIISRSKSCWWIAIVGTERHDSRRVDRQLWSCRTSRRSGSSRFMFRLKTT
jgi:preprotein translocase subunit SecA